MLKCAQNFVRHFIELSAMLNYLWIQRISADLFGVLLWVGNLLFQPAYIPEQCCLHAAQYSSMAAFWLHGL